MSHDTDPSELRDTLPPEPGDSDLAYGTGELSDSALRAGFAGLAAQLGAMQGTVQRVADMMIEHHEADRVARLEERAWRAAVSSRLDSLEASRSIVPWVALVAACAALAGHVITWLVLMGPL